MASRHRFYELLINDYAAHPRTIIISTHLVGEMEAIFDRAIILEQGKVVLDEQIDDLPGVAYEVSGHREHVASFVRGRNVLSNRSLGAMAQAVVYERATPGDLTAAQEAGLVLDAVSLQDLVAALGAQHPESSQSVVEEEVAS